MAVLFTWTNLTINVEFTFKRLSFYAPTWYNLIIRNKTSIRSMHLSLIVSGVEFGDLLKVSHSVVSVLVNQDKLPILPRGNKTGGSTVNIDIEQAYKFLSTSTTPAHLKYADRLKVVFPDLALGDVLPEWTIADIPHIVDELPIPAPRTLNETRTMIRIWQEAEDAKSRYRNNRKASGELIETAVINDMISKLHLAIQTNLGDGFASWANNYGVPGDAWMEVRDKLYNAFKSVIDETAVLVGDDSMDDDERKAAAARAKLAAQRRS